MSDLKIWKAIYQVRYPAAARLFDKRGEIAAKWQWTSDLTEWNIAQNYVMIHNKSKTSLLRAGFRDATVVMELPPSYTDFSKQATDFLLDTLARLDVSTIDRVGLRLIHLAQRKNFKVLTANIRKELFSLRGEDWDILGGYPVDVGIAFTLSLGENKANFFLGPMEKEQMVGHFESREIQEQVPAIALFVDFDLYREDPKLHLKSFRKDLVKFLEADGEKIQTITTNFVNRYGGFEK